MSAVPDGSATLEGRAVLVTGAAQGIGKAIARYLLQRGAGVLIADRDGEAVDAAAAELTLLGAAHGLVTDVSDEDAVRQAVSVARRHFGGLDGLVNNAGISDPVSGPVEALSLADWNRRIGVNLTGCFLCAKHAVPLLRERRGAMVNIASTRAVQSESNTEAYAASKGAIVALTHALAISLGPDVRVNCISPGWIAVSDWKKPSQRADPDLRPEDHHQHPAGRVGEPRDIATLTAFLLSTDAGFITGQNFIVDGGMTRKMIYVE